MKYLFFLLFSISTFAQMPDTEIFVFDIQSINNSISFSNARNISINPGYDNQPFFYDNNTIIYAGMRDKETDINQFEVDRSRHSWISNTEAGSEFSPQRIPGSNDIAAVRLDTTGLQLLYKYNYETGKPSVILPDTKVGYFAFYDPNNILAAVLNGSSLDLILYDLTARTSKKIISDAGRSIQKVPKSNSMSYTIKNEENNFDIYLLDISGDEPTSYFVSELPDGTQDFTWLDEYRILAFQGSDLYLFDTFGGEAWVKLADFSKYGITDITRLSVNPDGTKLALVGTKLEKPE